MTWRLPKTPLRRRPRHFEDNDQITLVRWFDITYPELSPLLWHTPNGGRRTAIEAKRFKMMGVRAGVPDLFLSVPCGTWHGLFIELKHGNNKASEAQQKYHNLLNERGYQAAIATLNEAKEIITRYLQHDRFDLNTPRPTPRDTPG